MKFFLKLAFLFLCLGGAQPTFLNAQGANATKQKTTTVPVSLKDGGVYKFTANYAYPMSGRSKYLSPTYDVIFSKDTLNGHLPYFGVATAVDYGSRDGGVNLQTADFTFEESSNKKGKYTIHYKVKGNDVSDGTFTIYKDGTADLQLNFLQRQSISYRGNVTSVNKP